MPFIDPDAVRRAKAAEQMLAFMRAAERHASPPKVMNTDSTFAVDPDLARRAILFEEMKRSLEELKSTRIHGKFAETSETSLGDSREMLSMRAMELAAELSKVLRHDPSAFQELKAGGKLVKDLVIVIAGQRISVSLELLGLGEVEGII